MADDMILVGYSHVSLIESLRPDVAYPDRKVRQSSSMVATVWAAPCECSGEHVEVWVKKVEEPF